MPKRDDITFRRELASLLPRARRFALVLTRNAAEADDLTQAALERAMVKASLYDPSKRLDTWVFKIMQNHWIDQRRKMARRGTQTGIDALAFTAGEDGRTLMETHDLVRRVAGAIGTLQEEQRAVVALVWIDGFKYQDAADVLGIPVGTVMSRLSRARQNLLARLGESAAP